MKKLKNYLNPFISLIRLSIRDIVEKIKGLGGFQLPRLRTLPDDLFLGLIIILVAFGAFGLGRLSKIEGSKTPIRVENAPIVTSSTFATTSAQKAQVAPQIQQDSNSSDQLVGSKGGTKYYYPWCTGVQKISPANLVHFASKSEAEARGYTASATCKGL